MKTFKLKLPLLTGLATLACAFGLHAANLTWDADPDTTSPQDGPGDWDTTTNTWWNGVANVLWDNATPDNASFGTNNGTAGPIKVGAGLTINVGNLTFNAPGSGNYNLTTGDANSRLSFSPSSVLTVASGLIITNTVVLTGSSSFTKAGPGTFSLRPSIANQNVGTTIVTDGTLIMGSSSARVVIPGDLIVTNTGIAQLGSSSTITNIATVSVSTGAAFNMAGGSQAIDKLVLNGGSIVQTGTETLTTFNFDAQSGMISGGTGKLDGNLTKSTAGTVTLATRGSSATTGGLTNTTVNAGTLILDYVQTSKLNDSGTLTVNGGTLIFSNGSYAEAVGNVILAGGVITNVSSTSRLSVANTGSYDVRAGEIYTVLSGTAGLTKSTGGTVILDAINTHSGVSVISGGTLLVNGTNTSSGNTMTVNAGTLGGTGRINGNVTVNAGGTFAPGAASGLIGQFYTDTTLTLGGHMLVDVNKSGATLTSDSVVGINTLNIGGDMTVSRTGDALAEGDSFQLFDHSGTGSFSSITPAPGANLGWSFDPATGVLSVISTGGAPPTLNVSQSGSTLMFSWTGAYVLQSQTNLLNQGLNQADWHNYPDTANPVNVNIDPANPTVFFRLAE